MSESNPEEFVQNFLSHEYDPVKAREYYLRTRKLKGRQPGKAVKETPSDEQGPSSSPNGARLVGFKSAADGYPQNEWEYADGSTYNATGWHPAKKAPKAVAAPGAREGVRLGLMQKKLDQLKAIQAKRDPSKPRTRELARKIRAIQLQVDARKKLLAENQSSATSGPKKVPSASTKPESKKVPSTRANPGSKVGYNGKPLKPLGRRIEEDETPTVSPSGAKLVDYDGKGLGRAIYNDGTVYDAKVGWKKAAPGEVDAGKARVDANRAKVGAPPLYGPKKAQAKKVPTTRRGRNK